MIQIKFYKKGKGMTTQFLSHFRTIFETEIFDPLSSHFRKHQVFKSIFEILVFEERPKISTFCAIFN